MHRLAIALIVLLAPALAHAEPMFTPLTEVYAKTETIVIARMKLSEQPAKLGPAVIHVEEVLHGVSKIGKREVGVCGGHAGVPQQQPFVGFLDESGGLCFIATPMNGGDVREDVLQVQGFYDFNAHLVGPSMATVPQIRSALAGKPHTFTFRGALHVVDTKTGGLAPTKHEISVRCFYTIEKGCETSKVEGLEWIEDFPEPSFGLSAWDPIVHLSYRGSWPRPLEIQGHIGGWDAKRKEHTVRFEATMPDLLTSEQLETYLKDPKLSHAVWHYTLTLSDGTAWSMSDGHDYTSGPRLVTETDETFTYSSFTFYDEQRELVFSGKGAPTITFDGHPASYTKSGTNRRFRHAALLGGMTFEVTKGPHEGEKGKLELEKVEWKGPVTAP